MVDILFNLECTWQYELLVSPVHQSKMFEACPVTFRTCHVVLFFTVEQILLWL